MESSDARKENPFTHFLEEKEDSVPSNEKRDSPSPIDDDGANDDENSVSEETEIGEESTLWRDSFYELEGDDLETLENLGQTWMEMGYETLTNDDFARLEPFLEPYDAVYNDEEISILSRLGRNGIQDEFVFLTNPPTPQKNQEQQPLYQASWSLTQDDPRRIHLEETAVTLFPTYAPIDALVMLTHGLATLRGLHVFFTPTGQVFATSHTEEDDEEDDEESGESVSDVESDDDDNNNNVDQ